MVIYLSFFIWITGRIFFRYILEATDKLDESDKNYIMAMIFEQEMNTGGDNNDICVIIIFMYLVQYYYKIY